MQRLIFHDDAIKWKHFPRYWPFVRGIHRSPVNSPQKGQWRGALMFTLICARINVWVNNRKAGDLRRNRVHYDVIVMVRIKLVEFWWQMCMVFSWRRGAFDFAGRLSPRGNSKYLWCLSTVSLSWRLTFRAFPQGHIFQGPLLPRRCVTAEYSAWITNYSRTNMWIWLLTHAITEISLNRCGSYGAGRYIHLDSDQCNSTVFYLFRIV